MINDYEPCRQLLESTVRRLSDSYQGPTDAQALIQYLEGLVLQQRRYEQTLRAESDELVRHELTELPDKS